MLVERLRQLTPAQRLEKAIRASASLWELAAADVRRRHPHADEREVRLRVASRSMPADLLKRATGWDVEAEGY